MRIIIQSWTSAWAILLAFAIGSQWTWQPATAAEPATAPQRHQKVIDAFLDSLKSNAALSDVQKAKSAELVQ